MHAPLTWQQELSRAVEDPQELLTLLALDAQLLAGAVTASQLFPLRVPRAFIARMRKNDITDPLLAQVLPLGIEQHSPTDYSADPLQEADYNPIPGLLHKYQNRVLLTITGSCAINCRFCFRRNFPYYANNPGKAGWQQVIDYIAADNSIEEVIFSGGDPLNASDKLLAWLTEQLAQIPHLQRLRIHTRLPIVIPARVTEELLAWLTSTRLKPVMILHANHAQELDDNVQHAISLMADKQITLLSQSVLLRGINDTASVLIHLSKRLFACRVLPYYLHVLDKTQGTAHFDVPLSVAKELHKEMAKQLSGYLVPRLVQEVAGMPSKVVVGN